MAPGMRTDYGITRGLTRGLTCGTVCCAMHLLALIALVRSSWQEIEISRLTDPAPVLTATILYEDSPRSSLGDFSPKIDPALEPLDAIKIPLPSLPDLSVVAADSFESAQEVATAEDADRIERLQGIYVRQINSRVSRILEMAASTAPASDESCVVHIIQDEMGNVVDVDLGECARGAEERLRLGRAIRAASPLPPPPAGLSMGSYLTVEFSRR